MYLVVVGLGDVWSKQRLSIDLSNDPRIARGEAADQCDGGVVGSDVRIGSLTPTCGQSLQVTTAESQKTYVKDIAIDRALADSLFDFGKFHILLARGDGQLDDLVCEV